MKQHYDVRWATPQWTYGIWRLMDGMIVVASVYFNAATVDRERHYVLCMGDYDSGFATLAAAKRAAITHLMASTVEL